MKLADDIAVLIRRMPGLTESQLAKIQYGHDGYRQKVNAACRELACAGRVERRGRGRPSDPFTYYPNEG